jgi:hypothetical protein
MTQLCCPACRVRVRPGSGPADTAAACPCCGQPLEAVAAQDALGYALQPALAANVAALAHAVAAVAANRPPPP